MENRDKNHLSRRKFVGAISGGIGAFMLQDALALNIAGDSGIPNAEPVGGSRSAWNLIGSYGEWASGKMGSVIPSHSLRNKAFTNLDAWRGSARKLVSGRIAMPDLGGMPEVKVKKQYTWDGLHIEELSWQLPYGKPAEAIFLKPAGAKGPLPAILAFHEHGGNKYFGKRKIVKTSGDLHPHVVSSQDLYYDGYAWANEIAKRGYAVLVNDAFPFESRRVLTEEVPDYIRRGLNDNDPEKPENIDAYNNWARAHEDIMAKSLFCSGTTWPGVWLAEDLKALDVLCARPDVDASRIGCGGLSGGGMRTVFAGGLDPRIKCAVCVGFMTTWQDFMLYKSHTHTWMTYVPILPNELDFPEILGLRVPSPVLVLNAEQDALFTLPEMKRADEILSEVYAKANASGNYRCSFYPGGHKFGSGMQAEAFEWFDKWLK